jgi:hypothetical protein
LRVFSVMCYILGVDMGWEEKRSRIDKEFGRELA